MVTPDTFHKEGREIDEEDGSIDDDGDSNPRSLSGDGIDGHEVEGDKHYGR